MATLPVVEERQWALQCPLGAAPADRLEVAVMGDASLRPDHLIFGSHFAVGDPPVRVAFSLALIVSTRVSSSITASVTHCLLLWTPPGMSARSCGTTPTSMAPHSGAAWPAFAAHARAALAAVPLPDPATRLLIHRAAGTPPHPWR